MGGIDNVSTEQVDLNNLKQYIGMPFIEWCKFDKTGKERFYKNVFGEFSTNTLTAEIMNKIRKTKITDIKLIDNKICITLE